MVYMTQVYLWPCSFIYAPNLQYMSLLVCIARSFLFCCVLKRAYCVDIRWQSSVFAEYGYQYPIYPLKPILLSNQNIQIQGLNYVLRVPTLFIICVGHAGHMPIALFHSGRVIHIWVSKLTIIGSDDSLSPGRHQAIIRPNCVILLVRPLGTNFNDILIEIYNLGNGGNFVEP